MSDFSEISSGDTMMCRLSRSVGVFSSFSSDGSLILLIPFDPEQFRYSKKNFLILKDNDSIECSNISREILNIVEHSIFSIKNDHKKKMVKIVDTI